MNIVDSSGWLEYFSEAPGADFFAPAIESSDELLVPLLSIYEVYKRIYQQRGRKSALEAVASMQLGKVIDLDPGLAIQAAEFSADEKIPMADSIIYVLAKTHDATLWTQDQDLKDLPNVKFQEKKRCHQSCSNLNE